MAVDRMLTFLKDRGAASLALAATVAAGGAMFACSSDSSKSEDSGSDSATGQTTNNTNTTSPSTTGGANNNTSSGPGGVTTTGTTTGGGSGNGNGNGNGTGNGTGTTGSQNTTSPNTTGGVNTTGATTGSAGSCGLSVDSYDISPAIATVGIVTWSATGEIESAEIKFGPAGGEMTMSAPVDLAEPDHRTLLLGMKPESEYQFQVVAQSGGAACTSDTFTLTTGSPHNDVPVVTRQVQQEGKADPGFYVTVAYARGGFAFIFDADGDPVWWAPASPDEGMVPEPSGVRMDFEGKALWTCSGNPSASGRGRIRRISMDGMEIQDLANTYDAHHDLAPLPGGSVAALIHSGDNCASIIEVHPDMTVTDIVPDVKTLYTPVQQCHPNAILYHPEDESFTISDRNPNLYVKFARASGEVQWQFGGANPIDGAIHFEETWNTNHGHHLLSNGNFLFFNNNGKGGGGSGSPVWEYELDLDSMTATEVWGYTSAMNDSTAALGDVQRLENGNTLITYSIPGVVHEVDEGGALVQTFNTASLGYLQHRRSLYGAPPK